MFIIMENREELFSFRSIMKNTFYIFIHFFFFLFIFIFLLIYIVVNIYIYTVWRGLKWNFFRSHSIFHFYVSSTFIVILHQSLHNFPHLLFISYLHIGYAFKHEKRRRHKRAWEIKEWKLNATRWQVIGTLFHRADLLNYMKGHWIIKYTRAFAELSD